jgi:signal transduction histidine kinase
MLKRRLKDAGLSDAFSFDSFRVTGITNYLENGGTLLTIINEILDFSQMETDRLTMELRDFNLCETVEDTLHKPMGLPRANTAGAK